MAEAMVQVSNPYFCHKCSQEISPVLPDYVCPRCRSGFIEEVTNSQRDNNLVNLDEFQSLSGSSDDESQYESLENAPSNTGQSRTNRNGDGEGGGGGITNSERPQRANPRVQLRYSEPFDSNQYQNQFQGLFHLISNISQGGGVDFPLSIDFPLFQVLYGNPGDYAWGSGGLDAVITQLLNQMDGTGPPPMPQEEISQLPTVQITQEQVDKNLQCTVCMEDYALDESVKKLSCTHLYHKDCILPWLEMHGTCPICRKLLNQNAPAPQTNNNSTTNNNTNTNNANSRHPNISRRRIPMFSTPPPTSQPRSQQNNNNNNNNRNNRNRTQNDGYCELPDDFD